MKICIESQEDGTFSVYETGAQPMGEGEMPMGEPIATLDEALAKAKEMLGGGEMGGMSPEKMLEDPAPAANAMQAGFKKARGPQAGY